MLLPVEKRLISKKWYGKEDTIWTVSFSCSKIIFAPRVEILALEMDFTLIYVRESSFQKPFLIALK